MGQYRKLIAYIVGIVAIVGSRFGLDLDDAGQQAIIEAIVAIATGIGIFAATNDGPGSEKRINSPAWVGVLALLVGSIMLSGCGGTRAAYSEAEGLEETAFVVLSHYDLTIQELNDLRAADALSPSALAHAQDIVRATRDPVLELRTVRDLYNAVESAENEQALADAITAAAVALSRLVEVVNRARDGTAMTTHCTGETYEPIATCDPARA